MASLVVVEEVSRWVRLDEILCEGERQMHLHEDNVGAGLGEGEGNSLADAAGASGDEGRMTVEREEGGHGDVLCKLGREGGVVRDSVSAFSRFLVPRDQATMMHVSCIMYHVGSEADRLRRGSQVPKR